MNIKGPTGAIPVDLETHAVEPTAPARESRGTRASPSQSVLLKLSPNLFQLGQILEVVVAKVERENLLLLLQNKLVDKDGLPIKMQFRVPRTQSAEVGQRLTVQVSELKDSVPKLTVIAVQKAELSIQNLLAQAQTKQQPLQQLLDNLSQLQNRNPKTPQTLATPLPKEINDRIQTLWRALPEANQIQQLNALKQGIQHSGPFLESQLLQASLTENRFFPSTDTKTNLLRIAEAIRHQLQQQPATEHKSATSQSTTSGSLASPSTTATAATIKANANPMAGAKSGITQTHPPIDPDIPAPPVRQAMAINSLNGEQILELLLQQTEGSLQRALAQQLHMLTTDNPRQPLIVELPIRNGQDGVDVFDLRIHPDQEQHQQAEEGPDSESKTWSVMMSFNLEGLGPVRAQINFAHGKVSTQWWAEQESTVALFKNNVETLQSRLSNVGAEINKLDCLCGKPKTLEAPIKTRYNDAYLDEQA